MKVNAVEIVVIAACLLALVVIPLVVVMTREGRKESDEDYYESSDEDYYESSDEDYYESSDEDDYGSIDEDHHRSSDSIFSGPGGRGPKSGGAGGDHSTVIINIDTEGSERQKTKTAAEAEFMLIMSWPPSVDNVRICGGCGAEVERGESECPACGERCW